MLECSSVSVGKHAPVTVKGLNEPEYSSSEHTIKSAAILLRLEPAGCMLELFNIGIEFIIFRGGGIHLTKLLVDSKGSFNKPSAKL